MFVNLSFSRYLIARRAMLFPVIVRIIRELVERDLIVHSYLRIRSRFSCSISKNANIDFFRIKSIEDCFEVAMHYQFPFTCIFSVHSLVAAKLLPTIRFSSGLS